MDKLQTPEEFSQVVGRHYSGDLMRLHESYQSAVDAVTSLIRTRDAAVRAPLVEALEKIANIVPPSKMVGNGTAYEMWEQVHGIVCAALEATKGE